jgi:hypothetical protein
MTMASKFETSLDSPVLSSESLLQVSGPPDGGAAPARSTAVDPVAEVARITVTGTALLLSAMSWGATSLFAAPNRPYVSLARHLSGVTLLRTLRAAEKRVARLQAAADDAVRPETRPATSSGSGLSVIVDPQSNNSATILVASGTSSRAEPARFQKKPSSLLGRIGEAIKKPVVTAAIVGVQVVGAAAALGAAETALGVITAYAVYRAMSNAHRARPAWPSIDRVP